MLDYYIFESLGVTNNELHLRCLAGPFSTKQEAEIQGKGKGYRNWRIKSHPVFLKVGEVITEEEKQNSDGYTMGPQLRLEVERQLFEDLQMYSTNTKNLHIDWSETIPEGHVTYYLDGYLEDWSSIGVLDSENKLVASGWIEFIHQGGNNPLFVFWQQLRLFKDNKNALVFGFGVPDHIWIKLTDDLKSWVSQQPRYRR